MKLIKASIENFGRISGQVFEFNSSLNEFYEKNGWGKSTLASFIKVMLFGFDNERVRDERLNERKRYKPWQGGTYGGSLEIEIGGKGYIISRSFGAKEKEDEFLLQDARTKLVSEDFSKNIGEELFEIDLESFGRTVYISQNDIYTEASGNIGAKIGNLTDNTDDINNFEIVDKRLTDILNSMSPTRKTGTIAKLIDEAGVLKMEVKNAAALDEKIDSTVKIKKEEKDKNITLRERQRLLFEKKKRLSRYKDVLTLKKGYEQLKENTELLKKKLSVIKEQLPERQPADEHINNIVEAFNLLKQKLSLKTEYALNEEEKIEFLELKKIFGNKEKDIEIFDEYIKKSEELINLKRSAEKTRITQCEAEELKELEKKFKDNKLNEAEIDLKVDEWSQKNELKSALGLKEDKYNSQKESLNRQHQNELNGVKKKNLNFIAWSIICAIMACVLLKKSNYFAPVFITASVGFICAYLYKLARREKKLKIIDYKYEEGCQKLKELKTDIEKDKSFIEKKESEMEEFFYLHDMKYDEAFVIKGLFLMKQQLSVYKKLSAKAEGVDKAAEESCRILDSEILSFLREFYKSFEKGDMYNKKLLELKSEYSEYLKYAERIKKSGECENSCEGLKKEIDEFYYDYELEKADDVIKQLLDLKINIRNYNDIFAEYTEAEKQLSEYVKNNGIDDDIINLKTESDENSLLEIDREVEAVMEKIEETNKNIAGYNSSLNELREKRDLISEKEEYLTQLEEKIAADKKKYSLIKKTKELLEASKNSLTARYMQPILDSFTKYYRIISKESTDKFCIDAKISITANEGGIPRKVDLLSEGTKDLVYICMRLALIDAMYTDEKPFIIFDDSFVNFDDVKVAGSLELLKEVSKEYQIIYFTCHNSRK